MSLLIVFATRGRPAKFLKALSNIHFTIGTKDFEIIVNADTDDESINNDYIREQVKQFPNVKIFFDPPVSKVHAINRNVDKAKPWTWSLVMSDDMEFVQYNWHDRMLAQIKGVWGESTYFFAHFSDGYVNEKLPTMNICGYSYYMRFGYFYYPGYGSVSCDAENMFVAMMLGRHHYFPEVYFNHVHPGNLPIPTDETYRRNDRFGENDTLLYFERMSFGFYVENPVMMPDEVYQRIKNKKKKKLAILIPTFIGREKFLQRLLDILMPQIEKYKDDVILLILNDNRNMTTGWKRNKLTEMAIDAGATHRAFIDCDDTVTEDYLDLNMPGVYQNYDCNTLLGIYSVNGVVNPQKHIFTHSLKYTHWYEDETTYYRNPNHLNVCSLARIGHIKFQEKNFGEDGCWSEDIAKANCLRNQFEIKKPFYNYLDRTKVNGI